MKKFSYEANGYNRREVIEFIDYVIHETELLIDKIKEQRKTIDELNYELQQYREQEDKYIDIINSALKRSNTIKEIAEYEADTIISTAKNDASRILNDALENAKEIDDKKVVLEDIINNYKNKLELLMEEQKTVLNKLDEE